MCELYCIKQYKYFLSAAEIDVLRQDAQLKYNDIRNKGATHSRTNNNNRKSLYFKFAFGVRSERREHNYGNKISGIITDWYYRKRS